jgi:hypothetical protein
MLRLQLLPERATLAAVETLHPLIPGVTASNGGITLIRRWARAPADALGVKQEFEKTLAQDGKPTTRAQAKGPVTACP